MIMEQSEQQTIHLNDWLQRRYVKVTVQVRPYNTQQLCLLYECSYKTFIKKLRPHLPYLGEKIGHAFTPLQVSIIFARMGLPYSMDELSEL